MGLLVGPVFLIASSFALTTGLKSRDALINPIYHLKSSANVLVEYEPGRTASAVQPQLFLRVLDTTDPTNNLACKQLQNEFIVLFVPKNNLNTFLQIPVSKTINLEQELNTQGENMPWIIFLKKENTIELPSLYRKINLKSSSPDDPWELGAYTLAPPGSELAEYPDEVLAAPPPFFPSLCVSPDKPRPFPVLFAPLTQESSAAVPSLASYTIADLTPPVASPMVAPTSSGTSTKLSGPAIPPAVAPGHGKPVEINVGSSSTHQ